MFVLVQAQPYHLAACDHLYRPLGRSVCGLVTQLIAGADCLWSWWNGLGVGLGSGIQKQFYLPEAHTDFVFSTYWLKSWA